MPLGLGDVDGEGLVARWAVEGQLEGFKVDGDLGAGFAPAGLGDGVPLAFGEFEREQAVAVGIAFEDIGESFPLDRGDHGSITSLGDGPDGMLSARSAAEVLADDEDGRASGGRLVERETRVFGAVTVGVVGLGGGSRQVAFVGEQQGAVAEPLDPLEVSGGDDQVGVDVGPVEDRDLASVRLERFHRSISSPGPASGGRRRSAPPRRRRRPSPG